MTQLATYHDQNRLIHETDRRLHAADMELSGGAVQIVPAVAEKMAPWARSSALANDRRRLLEEEGIEDDPIKLRELRKQRWWIDEWRRHDGLYRLRRLSRTEEEMTRSLLGKDGLPAEAFPRAQGEIAEDNDAQMVAQTIACSGRMILTSNRVLIDRKVLDRWLARHANTWPDLTADKLLADVDPLYTRWWKQSELGRRLLIRIVIAAYWPDRSLSRDRILHSVREGAQALERGHLKRFGALILERLDNTDTLVSAIDAAGEALPRRMREAEHRRRALLAARKIDRSAQIALDPEKDILGRFEWD